MRSSSEAVLGKRITTTSLVLPRLQVEEGKPSRELVHPFTREQ
jgi:hypothetical protein